MYLTCVTAGIRGSFSGRPAGHFLYIVSSSLGPRGGCYHHPNLQSRLQKLRETRALHSRALLTPSLPPAPNLSPRSVSQPCDTVAGVLGFVVRLETTRGVPRLLTASRGDGGTRGRGPVPAACLSSQRKRPEGSVWGRGRAGKTVVVLSARTPDPAPGGNVEAVSEPLAGVWTVGARGRTCPFLDLREGLHDLRPKRRQASSVRSSRVASRGAGPPRAPQDRRGPADPPSATA